MKKEKILDIALEQMLADEVLVRKVSKLGNSGHISIPSKHIGKTAKVIIRPYKQEDKINDN